MKNSIKTFFYNSYIYCLHVFALIGFVLVVGFFAIRFHFTDVKGVIDSNSQRFEEVVMGKNVKASVVRAGTENGKDILIKNSLDDLSLQMNNLAAKKAVKSKNYCQIDIIGKNAPEAAVKIIENYQKTDSDVLVSKMILAARLRIEAKYSSDVFAVCDNKNVEADDDLISKKYMGIQSATIFPWMDNDQWKTIREAIVKDKDVIDRAAGVVGIEPRLLVSCAIVEQVRLFNSNRELFKKFFEPLKILGNANKISLGIMGIKENTAIETENHLKDKNSPYYLGPEFEHKLDFENEDDADKRYDRLTENTHYFSYLYGAIYLKQMMSQWEKAGYDIKYRPEIVGTLFNVGFPQSQPNANPKVGGSQITVGESKYSFGSLAYEFYYSAELLDAFPYSLE
ncbi:MAG: hypothetical protein WCI36_02210 [bacterium]